MHVSQFTVDRVCFFPFPLIVLSADALYWVPTSQANS